jgi:hypothetical protein
VPTEEEQGECEQLINPEEPRGAQRTSLGFVSTEQSRKLERVSRLVGCGAAISGGEQGGESLFTVAKREAAKRMLYSKFYRGEVLKGEYGEAAVESVKGGVDVDVENSGGKGKKKRRREEGEGEERHHQKRKRKKKKRDREVEMDIRRVV